MVRELQSAGGFSGGGGGSSSGGSIGGVFAMIDLIYFTILLVINPWFWVFVAIMTGIMIILSIFYNCILRARANCIKCMRPTSEKWLMDANPNKRIKLLSSSNWVGNYTQDNASFFIKKFELRFDKNLECSGFGDDNIGAYKLKGRQVGHRVAITKTYIPGSGNSFHNRGHIVELLLEATDQNRLVGKWFIDEEAFSGTMTLYCDDV